MKFTFFEKNNDNKPGVAHSLAHIIHSRNLIILTVLRLLFTLAYGFFVTYFIVYAVETILLAPFLLAFLLGVRGATDMCLRIPVGRLVDRVNTKYFIFSGFSILAIVYYLLSEVIDFYLLILLMGFYGVALGIIAVAEWTMVVNNSPDGYRSVIAAYFSTIFNIGSGFGVILGGVLTIFMVIPDLFRISSVLMIIAVYITLLLQKRASVSFIVEEHVDDSS